MSTTATPSLEFVQIEQASCTHCESAIPRENILIRTNRASGTKPKRQCIEAYCLYCNTMFTCSRELRGSIWQIIGEVEVVTEHDRRIAIFDRIAAKRGERQVADADLDADEAGLATSQDRRVTSLERMSPDDRVTEGLVIAGGRSEAEEFSSALQDACETDTRRR